MVGGDVGALFSNFIPLSVSVDSTTGAQVFDTVTETFDGVGSLNFSREGASAGILLANRKDLVAGGAHCYAQVLNDTRTIAAAPTGATESGNTVTITTSSGSFLFIASPGNTVAISGVTDANYDGNFTITSVSGDQFTYTDLAITNEAASGGGTATENPEAACGTAISGNQCDALNTAELFDKATLSWTVAGTAFGTNPTGTMTASRRGATATLLPDGTVLIVGGSTGSSFLGLTGNFSLPPLGCGPSGPVALNTAEIYDPVADTFTATASIPGCAAGTAPPTTCPSGGLPAQCLGIQSGTITSATETTAGPLTTVTITVTPPLPTGLIVGGGVEIGGVGVAGNFTNGYNGVFGPGSVTSIIGDTFTYTDAAASGLGIGAGGFAIAEGTAQCGITDHVAQLISGTGMAGVDGTVLVAGGDYVELFGQSSAQAFLYVPAPFAAGYGCAPGTPCFVATGPMSVPREIPALSTLNSGSVLVVGGITGAANACVNLPAACTGPGTPGTPTACCTGVRTGPNCGPVALTTQNSGEVYDPVTRMWTLVGSLMQVKRAALPGTHIPTGLATGGALAGDEGVMLAGGIDAETTDGTNPNFPACAAIIRIAQGTTNTMDFYDAVTGAIVPDSAKLTQKRGAQSQALLTTGNFATANQIISAGGECTNPTPTLESWPIGASRAENFCNAGASTQYGELYDPVLDKWTLLPAQAVSGAPCPDAQAVCPASGITLNGAALP